MIISFLNQKGGVGKTTLALNVAGELARDGKARVLVIDADPQGSSLDWAASREEKGLFTVIGLPTPTVHKEIAEVGKGYAHIIIDGPGRVTELARSIIMASDIVIVPVQPSPYDVWAVEEIVSMLKEADAFKPNLRAALVINRRVVNTAIGRDLNASIGGFGVPILSSVVCHRVLFAESAAFGKLAHEVQPESLAACEIVALTKEILEVAA